MALDPWAGIKAAKAKLLAETPPPPDDEDDPAPIRRHSPGIQREGITPQEWAFAGLLLTVGAVGWAFVSPIIFHPDYTPIQKYFTAKGDPDGGEHVVEMFRAHDAGLNLSLKLLYHDRPENRIAAAPPQPPKETKE